DTFDWFVRPFDTSTGELGTTSLLVEMGRRTAVLDDGRVVVFATDRSSGEPVIGPVGAWDPSSGDLQPLWGCAARVSDLGDFDPYVASTGSCVDGAETYFDYDRALISGDRSTLVVSSRAGDLLIFDPSTLELVEASVLPESAASVKDVGATWLATSNLPKYVGSPTEEITLFSLPAMEAIVTVPGRIVESDRTGAFLAVEDGPGHVTVLDTSNGEVVTEFEGGTGRVRGLAFSPDGSLFMTSATDGFVRIWEVSSGTEIERIPLGGDSGDGYWIDDDTIAIGTFEGVWTNLDIGLDSLLDLARSSLLRSFTEQECLTYRIDPCPTLDEMRSR
ncbi:MAG: hypothetical protein OEO77_11020, partial [Acidimicrobiia bacterium]|nr:hypothetical protein [Acidimicrobiia bacterium]